MEIYPSGAELRQAGADGRGFAMGEAREPAYGPTHFAMSVQTSPEAIAAIAAREGWACYLCARGGGDFHVMEVWIENAGMIELLPPAFAEEYLALTRRRMPQPA